MTQSTKKKAVLEDELTTLKAEFMTRNEEMKRNSSLTAQDLHKLKADYDHERNSIVRCAKDNNVSLDDAYTNDNVDGETVNESVNEAIRYKGTEGK